MAIAEYTTISGGLAGLDKKNLRRFLLLHRHAVSHQRTFYTRLERKTLPTISLLPEAADAWNLLSSSDKTDWNTAGAVIGFRGYNLFIQDKIYRLLNSLPGNATPNIYHQYLVGHLNILSSSGDVTVRQTGNVIVPFPATLYIRRKTILLPDPSNGEYVKILFSYTYDSGGGVQTETAEISLPLSDDWGVQSVSLVQRSGVLGPFFFEIQTHAVKGDLYFDDVWVDGTTEILSKDPYCDRVSLEWFPIVLPVGCTLESVYP